MIALYILGLLHILGITLTFTFMLADVIKEKDGFKGFFAAIFLSTIWPYLGYWAANAIYESKRKDRNFWRRKYYDEVDKNEELKETTKSEEEGT